MTSSSVRTRPTLHGSAAVFVVQDVTKSVAHYRDVLGFAVDFLFGEPTFYAGVERDAVLIHLHAAARAERRPGQASVYIFVSDVDALHREFEARGARVIKAPQDYDYGMRDFDVLDLDGNHLCFGMESKRVD